MAEGCGFVVKHYPLVEDLLRPVLRVAMPRAARVVVPGGSMHVVVRCNNREFYLTTSEDIEVLLVHLHERSGWRSQGRSAGIRTSHLTVE